MTDQEITALAREYAEEMIKGKLSEELPNCLKNSMLTMNTEYIAEVFRWLTRRYCLVEKDKAREVYAEQTFRYDPDRRSVNTWMVELCEASRAYRRDNRHNGTVSLLFPISNIAPTSPRKKINNER